MFGKYKMTIIGAVIVLLAASGAAVFYVNATTSHRVYAIKEPIQKGGLLAADNLRVLEVATLEPNNLVNRETVNYWITEGYVAEHRLTESSWLRPDDFIQSDDRPAGYVNYRLPAKVPGAEIGDSIRLYATSELLGVHPFPCIPDVDMMVNAAQRSGVTTLGWQSKHAELLNIPQEVIAELNPAEGGWQWYRLMAQTGRAGISPRSGELAGYQESAALAAYNPKIHLAPYYDMLCGMALYEIVAIEDDNTVVELPGWLVPSFHMAQMVLAVLPPDGSVSDSRYVAASPPAGKAFLDAPLLAEEPNPSVGI